MIPALLCASTVLVSVSAVVWLALRLDRAWRPIVQAYLEAKANQKPMIVPDPPDIGPPKFYRPIIHEDTEEPL
jgi:hypothetical protein